MQRMTKTAITSLLALVAVLAFPPGAQAVGELSSGGCVNDATAGADTCAQSTDGLLEPIAVAVSPDGKSVYAATSSYALVRFNRSATGALTPMGCIQDNDLPSGIACDLAVNGIEGANSVVVSPDGKSVYLTSQFDNAIVRFNRGPAGELTPAGCIDDNDDGPDGCALSVNGLEAANGLDISPDGTSVYVTSGIDDAVVRFNRSSTGALTSGGCVDDNDEANDVCALSVNGLGNAADVVVSSDGRSVYAVSAVDDAVVRLNRSTTGALTAGGCIDDNDEANDVCAQSVNGLGLPVSLDVSPDGNSVYATGQNDSAVVRFNRSTTGALTPAGCIDDNDNGSDTCAQSINGLSSALLVTVSPDNQSVYVSGAGDDAITRFGRSPIGALTPGGCVDDNDTGPEPCALSVNSLASPFGLAVSPDGRSLYAAVLHDDAVTIFNRQT